MIDPKQTSAFWEMPGVEAISFDHIVALEG